MNKLTSESNTIFMLMGLLARCIPNFLRPGWSSLPTRDPIPEARRHCKFKASRVSHLGRGKRGRRA